MNRCDETLLSCESCGADAMEQWAFGAQLCASCAVLVGMCKTNKTADCEDPVEICREVFKDVQNQLDGNRNYKAKFDKINYEDSKYISKKDFDLIEKLRNLPGRYLAEKKALSDNLKAAEDENTKLREEIKKLKSRDMDALKKRIDTLAREKQRFSSNGTHVYVSKDKILKGKELNYMQFHFLYVLAHYGRPMSRADIIQKVRDRLLLAQDKLFNQFNTLEANYLVLGQIIENTVAYYLTPYGFVKFREHCGLYHEASDPWR